MGETACPVFIRLLSSSSPPPPLRLPFSCTSSPVLVLLFPLPHQDHLLYLHRPGPHFTSITAGDFITSSRHPRSFQPPSLCLYRPRRLPSSLSSSHRLPPLTSLAPTSLFATTLLPPHSYSPCALSSPRPLRRSPWPASYASPSRLVQPKQSALPITSVAVMHPAARHQATAAHQQNTVSPTAVSARHHGRDVAESPMLTSLLLSTAVPPMKTPSAPSPLPPAQQCPPAKTRT